MPPLFIHQSIAGTVARSRVSQTGPVTIYYLGLHTLFHISIPNFHRLFVYDAAQKMYKLVPPSQPYRPSLSQAALQRIVRHHCTAPHWSTPCYHHTGACQFHCRKVRPTSRLSSIHQDTTAIENSCYKCLSSVDKRKYQSNDYGGWKMR